MTNQLPEISLEQVSKLVLDAYVPFAQEERAIPWPRTPGRWENDAEHSFSLALVGIALGEQLDLNPQLIAYYATVHDLPEIFSGDTSVWDVEGLKTKKLREDAAIERISIDFKKTPILACAVRQYEAKEDEEARFVYALDKLLALVMIVADNGKFWKDSGITYEHFLVKIAEKIKQVAAHPAVSIWYRELLDEIDRRKADLFALSV